MPCKEKKLTFRATETKNCNRKHTSPLSQAFRTLLVMLLHNNNRVSYYSLSQKIDITPNNHSYELQRKINNVRKAFVNTLLRYTTSSSSTM